MKTLGSVRQFAAGCVAASALAFPVPATADTSRLGDVSLDISCKDDARPSFETGLLLLHHMMYREAAAAFEEAAHADPQCAMAQWGIAMSKFHPLWPGGPTPEETEAGHAAAIALGDMNTGSALEAEFTQAVMAFYAGDDVPYRARLTAWATAQRAVEESFPDHDEAVAFGALAQLTLAPRGPEAVPELSDAGARMDRLRARSPLHPAGYHYAIHAYDHPALAERGLEPARSYLDIAPQNPHALHMPTHIFTRLGLAAESSELNRQSAAAVIAQSGPDVLSGHYIHALDYAIYAELQKGNVDEAEDLLAALEGHANHENVFGTAYAAAAAPSRLPLEQDDWQAAAALPTQMHPAVSWERYPQAVAIRWFAIGLGAARSGDTATAQAALSELSELRQVMEERKANYWLMLLSAQTGAIEAWLALANGDAETAIALMRDAADIEDKVGKAPVTPGHVLPARELYGDLLLEVGDKAAAEDAYLAALGTSPNRRRSLQGLQRATAN
ncbi:hypothetical protein MWU54_10050 [Marivita sp. S6314]|uniref:hypothetical protein n=1 Tax=Marivita sp. S6314 TaxID=2926406 RepID=UPI001FF5F235|nr:hypothetical protein [Marivita sp. S6314]MCK0150365.1 hypothetical protein [Marivita sp. S6314]